MDASLGRMGAIIGGGRAAVNERRVNRARLPRVPHVGSRMKRPDDPRILTGRGRYVDDLALPRMVHAAFVRSVHAHARIAHVELGAARKSSGVVAVLTGADVVKLCTPYRGVLQHYAGMKTGAIVPLAQYPVCCDCQP